MQTQTRYKGAIHCVKTIFKEDGVIIFIFCYIIFYFILFFLNFFINLILFNIICKLVPTLYNFFNY